MKALQELDFPSLLLLSSSLMSRNDVTLHGSPILNELPFPLTFSLDRPKASIGF